jgi:hypothetical protein
MYRFLPIDIKNEVSIMNVLSFSCVCIVKTFKATFVYDYVHESCTHVRLFVCPQNKIKKCVHGYLTRFRRQRL